MYTFPHVPPCGPALNPRTHTRAVKIYRTPLQAPGAGRLAWLLRVMLMLPTREKPKKLFSPSSDRLLICDWSMRENEYVKAYGPAVRSRP